MCLNKKLKLPLGVLNIYIYIYIRNSYRQTSVALHENVCCKSVKIVWVSHWIHESWQPCIDISILLLYMYIWKMLLKLSKFNFIKWTWSIHFLCPHEPNIQCCNACARVCVCIGSVCNSDKHCDIFLYFPKLHTTNGETASTNPDWGKEIAQWDVLSYFNILDHASMPDN